MHYLALIITVAVLIGNQPAQGRDTNSAAPELIEGAPMVSAWFKEAQIQNVPDSPLRNLIDGGPVVISLLTPLLQEETAPRTQAKAAFVISCVAHRHPGSPEARAAVPMLTRTALSTNVDVRTFSAQALAAVGKDATNAVSVLIRLTKDTNEGVRISVVDALGRVAPKSPDSVAALKAALSDVSSDVQLTARQALGIARRDGK